MRCMYSVVLVVLQCARYLVMAGSGYTAYEYDTTCPKRGHGGDNPPLPKGLMATLGSALMIVLVVWGMMSNVCRFDGGYFRGSDGDACADAVQGV